MAVGDDDPENREIGIAPPSIPPPSPSQTTSWLIPLFAVTNVTLFSITMFINNCPNHSESHSPKHHHCVAARFLGRLSFEPLPNNPLFGPSSLTFVVTLVMLFRGEDGNDHCSWCQYLRCIPTSRWSCEDV